MIFKLYASDASPLAQGSSAYSHDEVVVAAAKKPVFFALKKIHRSCLIIVHRRQSARTLLCGILTRIYNIYGLIIAAWAKLQKDFGMTLWIG
ncbi:hypothetical protein Aduo_012262 [Ancylostoma duodenale]